MSENEPRTATGCIIAQRITGALTGMGIPYQELADVVYGEFKAISREQQNGDWLEFPTADTYTKTYTVIKGEEGVQYVPEYLTSRKDIKRDKHPVRCLNSTVIGFSCYTLNYGDFFVWKDIENGRYLFCRCHGRVKPSGDATYLILAQVMNNSHQYTMERWVRQEEVVETVPFHRANAHTVALFNEYLLNQNSDKR